MDIAEAFRFFDRHIRKEGLGTGGATLLRRGRVLLARGRTDYVVHWDFQDGDATSIVADLVQSARTRSVDLIWRLYEGDGPPALGGVLERSGFLPLAGGELVARTTEGIAKRPASAIIIRKVDNDERLGDFLYVSKCAFGEPFELVEDQRQGLINLTGTQTFVAYLEGVPVGAAQLDTICSNPAALLRGGAVLPDYRGQGIYQALVNKRLLLSRERGVDLVFAEARPASRPILFKMGFVRVASGITWTFSASE
ncbi:GNAT family N-acetyltransferase [Jannaschia formosa]|uniref:GNAT family N-acetyltransferase n=1 Tax=Jannaschia formosa TaxID=2259592 RepID=UPI00143064C4|nr:GNAT family N-acetyltransferase [Jannaschia formosa]